MNKTASSAKGKKARKPVRRAKQRGAQVLPMAGKLALILVAIVAMGLMFSALQAVGSDWLRILLSLLIASGMLLLCYSEGLTRGVRDADASRFYVHLEKEGQQPTAQDDRACYHPLKGICAALVVFIVPLALAVYLAVTAQPYTYTLQDLPVWLTDSYGTRSDVMGPLGAYAVTVGMTATDWVRLFVRLTELIFVNLFSDPQTMVQTIDRLSPLFVFSYPLMYAIGYLCGPAQSAKRQAQYRRAKKVAVRKAQKSTLASELLGNTQQVHYGHKPDSEKPKKKELI